jgi:hypothetical protein
MKLRIPESEVQEAEKKAMEAKEQENTPVLPMLAAYIKGAYETAVQHRESSGVTRRLTECRRLKKGEYDSEKLKQIRAVGSSELFYNLTESKCEAFVAWMTDVFNSGAEIPWGITPTPIPSLSTDEVSNVETLVVQRFTKMSMEDEAYAPTPEEVREYTVQLYDETLKMKMEDAKERAERMERIIQDQTAEGGYMEALSDFFEDLATYPTAFLKGPVFIKKKRLKWKEGKIEVVQEAIPTWTAVDPFNVYPGPNARTANDSYFCEVIDYDRSELANMRKMPGWKSEAINKVLGATTAVGNGGGTLPGESEMEQYEDKQTLYARGAAPDATVRGIEFWGNVQGKMLLEWGMSPEKITDENSFYQVTCVMVNDTVVKSILNPHPLGCRPYYATSFSKSHKSVWGNSSIPEKLRDCQDGVNVCQRNLLNNLAFAAGPQVSVDLDTVPPSHIDSVDEQCPMKVWLYHGTKSQSSRRPVEYFQPNTNASQLQEASEFYERKADDRTLIPRYVTGDQNISGAGATASGLSMLMNAASRGIKRVIRSVDQDAIRPSIRDMYVYNMIHSEDESIKGDSQIIPKGAVAMMVKEQTQLRRQEFLSLATSNQMISDILGVERITNLLRAIASGLDMDKDDVVPSKEEMQQIAQSMQAMQEQEQEPIPEEQPA